MAVTTLDRAKAPPRFDRDRLEALRSPDDAASPRIDTYAVIDARTLERACFVQCLTPQAEGAAVRGFPDVEAWHAEMAEAPRQVLLVNLGSASLDTDEGAEELSAIVERAGAVPVVVLGPCDEIDSCIAALDCGAAGYIPPSLPFTEILHATWLAVSGGVFLPRESLLSLRGEAADPVQGRVNALDAFTERQIAVANVLRCGAANKTIAYKLSLRESTVKVHIRNIFEKLKVTNRTEAAFLLNQMVGWPATSRPS